MSNPRKQWLLKVIAGPHQGAEIGLYAGKTLIGSDGECDVVLHDVLVATQHLELELSDSGMVAAPLGGRVYTNGKRIREARQAVPEFGFISIGGTHLVVGSAEGKWPLLSAADVPELEKEAPPPPEPEKVEEASPAEAATATATSTMVKPVAGTTVVVAPAEKPAPSRLGPLVGIAAGVVLLMGWAVVYQNFKSGDSPKAHVDDTPLERARAVVEDFGVLGSVKVEEAGGRISAAGYVDTEAKQRELQAAFRGAVPGMRTKIYSLEKIATSARSLVESRRLPLTVSSLSEGKLKVTGKMPSADPWVQMRQALLREVPGVSSIEDGVEIEAQRALAPNMIYVPVPAPITVSGAPQTFTPAPAPASSLAAPLPQLTTVPAGSTPPAPVPQPDPNTDFLITADTIDTPEATVSSIRANEGGLAYVRLSTGGVYFLGARLPYGGTVSAIEEDSITVIEKGVTRTIRQGDTVIKARNTTSAAP